MKILASIQVCIIFAVPHSPLRWVAHPSNLINNPNIPNTHYSHFDRKSEDFLLNKFLILNTRDRVRSRRRVSRWDSWCRPRERPGWSRPRACRQPPQKQEEISPQLLGLWESFSGVSWASCLRHSPETPAQALNNWETVTLPTTKSLWWSS